MAVLIAALTTRVLYVLTIRQAYFFDHLQTEPKNYEDWASLISAGQAPLPPYEQSPGFAYFLSAISGLGPIPLTCAIVQCAFGALTCWLLAAIARDWFGDRAGVATGLLAAFYGPLVYYCGAVLPETLFILLVTAALWCAARNSPDHGRRAAAWLASGALWGAAFLVRSNVLLALPFVAYDAFKQSGRRALFQVIGPIGVVWATLAIANCAYGGRFVATVASGGENLWLGNNAFADGVSPFPTGPLEAIAENVRTKATDMVAANERLKDFAWQFAHDHPADAGRLALRKLIWTFHTTELPNAGDPAWETSHSWVFRNAIVPVTFGALLPLGLFGAAMGWHRLRRRTLLSALAATALGTCVVFFTNGRFRLTMVPPLLLLAGLGVDELIATYRSQVLDRMRLIPPASAALVGIVAGFNNYQDVRSYFIPEIEVNIGILDERDGNLGGALEHLTKGIAANPLDGLGRIHLASVLNARGDVQGAVQVYLDGLKLTPGNEQLQTAATEFLSRHESDIPARKYNTEGRQ